MRTITLTLTKQGLSTDQPGEEEDGPIRGHPLDVDTKVILIDPDGDPLETVTILAPRLNYRPLADYIVVRRDPAKTHDGAIQLAPIAQQHPDRGTILAIGPHVSDADLTPGARIIFSNHAGAEVPGLSDPTLILLTPREILCILTEDPAPPSAI